MTSNDGTDQRYPMKTGVVSANTWTKIIKVIPGNSNIEITSDYGKGMDIMIYPYLGNSHVGGSSINTWSTANVSNFGGSSTSTWYTTDDATFEITGVQLEVGSTATPFEHKTFAEDLRRCQRYYQEQQGHSDLFLYAGKAQGSSSVDGGFTLNVPMRAQPTLTCGEHRAFKSLSASQTNSSTAPTITSWDDSHSTHSATLGVNLSGHSGFSNNEVVNWCPKSSLFTVDSEL